MRPRQTLQRLYGLSAVDISEWERQPEMQQGSKAGSLFRAPDGTLHYFRFHRTAGCAKHELAALRIYAQGGLDTADARTRVSALGRAGALVEAHRCMEENRAGQKVEVLA